MARDAQISKNDIEYTKILRYKRLVYGKPIFDHTIYYGGGAE